MDSTTLEKPKISLHEFEIDGSGHGADTNLDKDNNSTSLHGEKLKGETREQDHFESTILPRIESKERELRHFLIPRSLHLDTSQVAGIQNTQPTSVATGTTIPIQSTVPAIRPVPSLIGGLVKNNSDGLLPLNNTLASSGSQSPAKPGNSCVSSTIPSYSSQPTKQTASNLELRKNHWDSPNRESSSEVDPYNEVLVDPSVLLVFSRLRSAQEHCSALVSTNQTDLQSFTFTQNSQNGKRIMMRVRVLKQENQELAVLNRTGRAARLETEMLLRRNLLQDLKEAHADMEYLVEEAEVETETLGSSLLVLQQRLNLARTMAQVLASALVAEDPSGQLLNAVVSSKLPHQSVDWLLGSAVVDEKPESVEAGEERRDADQQPSADLQPKHDAVNDLVDVTNRDMPTTSTTVSPHSSHKERHAKRHHRGFSTDDDHRRRRHSSHKKSRLTTEEHAKTFSVVNEAIDPATSAVDSASPASELQSSRNSAVFPAPEDICDDSAINEHLEHSTTNYDEGICRNIFDEASSSLPKKPPLSNQISSSESESKFSLTNGDQPD